MRETYWELMCLDCGNGDRFYIEVSIRDGQMIGGDGELLGEDAGVWTVTRRHWDTLECPACQSTNVQRKRRSRKVEEADDRQH